MTLGLTASHTYRPVPFRAISGRSALTHLQACGRGDVPQAGTREAKGKKIQPQGSPEGHCPAAFLQALPVPLSPRVLVLHQTQGEAGSQQAKAHGLCTILCSQQVEVEPESLRFFFETGSHGTAPSGLGFWILLPPPPECWGNKYSTPHPLGSLTF